MGSQYIANEWTSEKWCWGSHWEVHSLCQPRSDYTGYCEKAKPGLSLEQWSNFIAGVSQTREAVGRSGWSTGLKSGRASESRHHNSLLHDLRPSNLIFLNLNLLNCKTGSIISPGLFWKLNVIMNTRSQHNAWPKGRAAILSSFLSLVMSS